MGALGGKNNRDHLVWHFSLDGSYSVKGGCKLIRDQNLFHSQNETGSNSSNAPIFSSKWIWKLGVQNKVKHFLWRVWSNSLPTRSNLERLGIQVNMVCPVCEGPPETGVHVLVDCSFARQALARCGLPTAPINSIGWDSVHLISSFIGH